MDWLGRCGWLVLGLSVACGDPGGEGGSGTTVASSTTRDDMTASDATVTSTDPATSTTTLTGEADETSASASTDDGSETTADQTDSTGEPPVTGPLVIEIHNTSEATSLYLDSCPRCGTAFQVWEQGGAQPLPRPSSILHCLCPGDCTSTGCLGIADPPIGWIEVPPQTTLVLQWDAMIWEAVEMGCESGGTCLAPSTPHPDGAYELRLAYAMSALTSAERPCPGGEPPHSVWPQADGTSVAECELLCLPNACPSDPALDQTAVVAFDLPAPRPVIVEIDA